MHPLGAYSGDVSGVMMMLIATDHINPPTRPRARMGEFSRKPAYAVPNWKAPTSIEKPAGQLRAARWRAFPPTRLLRQ